MKYLIVILFSFLSLAGIAQEPMRTVQIPATSIPANDDVLQRKAGRWQPRTLAQLAADLEGVGLGAFDSTYIYSAVNAHIGNTSNPHSVTKTQVGLGNADNTSDANKPISVATQAALDLKAALSHNHDGTYAPVSHTHSAGDVSAGTFGNGDFTMDRLILPTSTTNANAIRIGDLDLFRLNSNTFRMRTSAGAGMNLDVSAIIGNTIQQNGSANNANLVLFTTGGVFTRNVGDGNTAFAINQQHASSTGKILDLQFGGSSKASFDKDGNLDAGRAGFGVANVSTHTLRIADLGAKIGYTTIGRSGSGYGMVGDGIRYTTTTNSFLYDRNDFATVVDFASGNLSFKTAPSGTIANAITFTSRLFIANDGKIGLGTETPTHTLTLPSTATGIASYNTSDQTTNYERVRQYWSSNVFNIASENGGTGTQRNITITAPTVTVSGIFNTTGDIVTGGGIMTSGTTTNANLAVVSAAGGSRTTTSNYIFGSGTGTTFRIGERGNTNITVTNGDDYASHILATQALTTTTTVAGSHSFVSQFVVKPLNVTMNNGSIANAATLYVTGASNATVSGRNDAFRVDGSQYYTGKASFDATNTTAGTTGNQTINKPTGTVNVAAAGTSVTVTNSLVTTSSIVYCVLRTNDANATAIKSVVPGSGSFVINLTTAPAAEVSIGFVVFN